MTTYPTALRRPTFSGSLPVKSTLLRWLRNSQSRKALLHLSEERLIDVGLSRTQAAAEANKYFWQ